MISNPFQRTSGQHSLPDWSAVLILVLLAVWLFRGHFFGEFLWMGNPDRLNSDFKILKHYLSGLRGGHIAAWNEHEMMGYDSFVLPYTFPNPLVYIVALFGENNLYLTMGYVGIFMLAAAGAAAYAFIRAELPAGIPALAGAICYEFSALTVLKVSQNSMSFAVFIVIPLLALAIRRIRRDTAAYCFVALAFLLSSMLTLMFLQKAAYALMLIGAYAVWRTYADRTWYPLLVFSASLAVGIIFSWPRVIGVATAIGEYARIVEGRDLRNFEVLYDFQKIYPEQIYRWFDYSIFGRTPSQEPLLGNNLNLTEGFLLYTSAIVPFLLLTALIRYKGEWVRIVRASSNDVAFFFWALVGCIAVIVLKPVANLVFVLFLRMDFTHARVLIAALLPLSILVALVLTDLAPRTERDIGVARAKSLGLALGLLGALTIEAIAAHFPGTVLWGDLPRIRDESLARIGSSLILYLALLALVVRSKSFSERYAAHTAICALVISQCLIAANEQVNGPETRNFLEPFTQGDSYYAKRAEFAPPTEEQIRNLHRRIQPDRYRVALICAPEIAGGFCAGHVPEFWQLRAIDGYYGLGVPHRLRTLPWPSGASLRTISFNRLDEIPWDFLGFLNVRWVLASGDGLYRNIVRENGNIIGHPDPAKFEVVASPARVTPRVFFADAVVPVPSMEDAVSHIFRSDGIVDPEKTSFVEGLTETRRFVKGGSINLQGADDVLEIHFEPTASERFLVLNDLYYPGWHADVDGRELPILATNVVMRGILVPPGADHVRFRYVTYSARPAAWLMRIIALLAAMILFLGLRRTSKR